MARDILTRLAWERRATVSYQDNQVTIVPEGAAKPGAEVVLNSSTGLVGMPTQTGAGIYARCLINPSIVVHGRVRIAQKDVNPGAAEINPLTGNNDLGLAQGKRPIFA